MSFQRTFPICQFSYKAGSVFSAKRRSALLLAAAFVAGAVINPASDLIARHIGVSAAFAQDTDRAETYKLLKLFGDAFALDAKTGKKLWSFSTGSGISGSPISYSAGGRQFIAIPSGLQGAPATLIAPLWPEDAKKLPPVGSTLFVFALPGKGAGDAP